MKNQTFKSILIQGLLTKSEGEGSHGGKIIGHTKSGKPIYDSADHASHNSFSVEDRADAITTHQTAAKIAPENQKQHKMAINIHQRHIDNKMSAEHPIRSTSHHAPEAKDINEHPTGFSKSVESQDIINILKKLV